MKFLPYSKDYDSFIQQYVLTDDQLLYTALPLEAIEILDEERHAVLAFDDDLFVSFFVLHEGSGPKEFMGEEDSILLRSFSTDNRYQGKGYATQIMKELPSYVQKNFPSTKSIVLAVNEGNTRASHLYLKCGYKDYGKRMHGSRAPLIILEYSFV